MSQTVWPLNENGEIVFSAGTGSSSVTGYLNQDVLPSADGGIPAVFPSSGVSFKQAGAGAISRKAEDKLRETISVKDFGAKGDGIADDTDAINAAYASAGTTKAVVVFPPTNAHYKITRVIDVPLGVNTFALGATIKRYHPYTVNNQAFNLNGNNIIYGMIYDGNAAGINDASNFTLYHDFNCIATTGGQEEFFKFDSCTFLDAAGSFILSSSVRDIIVTGNKFYKYKDHCVYLGNSANPSNIAQNAIIANNVFRASSETTRDAIKVRNGIAGITVSGNEFYLPNAIAMTFDHGDVVNVNVRNTRILVIGNNGVCSSFVRAYGDFDGGDGNNGNGDILITGNTVDCLYLFNNGAKNWNFTNIGAIGCFDSIIIQGNTVKGGQINVCGAKNRPVRAGAGASATAVLTGDAVTSITLGSGGSGYTRTPVISLRDATNSGFGATARVTVSGGAITGFTVITGGIGYTAAPTVFFEEYGVNTLIVKGNNFLPREEVSSGTPGSITVLGDVAYSDISENTFDAVTSNFYGVDSPISPFVVSSVAKTRAQVTNDLTQAAPCKPRIFKIERNYFNSSNTITYEPASGHCTDGSATNDYDTFIVKDNIFDLKFAPVGTSAPVASIGNANRAKWSFVNNKQVSNTSRRTAPDYTGQKVNWTMSGNINWSDIGVPAGSVTYDPPSVAAGGQASTTVTVTGAFLGDTVVASFSNNLNGLILSAQVSSNNTVTCTFFNPTGSAVDLASGTLRAKVVY